MEVRNRYVDKVQREQVAHYLYEILGHHLTVRSENTRNVIRLLSQTIAYPKSRLLASIHLAGILLFVCLTPNINTRLSSYVRMDGQPFNN